jgi:hypothetical protein
MSKGPPKKPFSPTYDDKDLKDDIKSLLNDVLKLDASIVNYSSASAFGVSVKGLLNHPAVDPSKLLFESVEKSNKEEEDCRNMGLKPGMIIQLKQDYEKSKPDHFNYSRMDMHDKKSGEVLMYLGAVPATIGQEPVLKLNVQRWLYKDKIILANISPLVFDIIDTRASKPKKGPDHG